MTQITARKPKSMRKTKAGRASAASLNLKYDSNDVEHDINMWPK